MERLVGRIVFTAGTRDYRWEDVFLAAHLWSDWAGLERRTREGIACRKHLDGLGEDLPEEKVEEAADAWRYERDLLSADDTEAWLQERGLELEEWLEYVRRSVLRSRWLADLERIVSESPVSSDEVDGVLLVEAICSGTLAQLAERLAGRVAIFDRVEEEAGGGRPAWCGEAELRPRLDRLPPQMREQGLLGVPPALVLERAELLTCVTLSFERFLDRIAAPAALEREIEPHALEWTRLECEAAAFPAEETVREAALLVREDGMPLAEAAVLANTDVRETRYVLEDVEPSLKDRLVGALPGELIGPLPHEKGFLLVSVVDRVEPSIEDPAIRERARELVVRRTIQRETGKRVRWHERL